ncbi:MAG: ComEC/Rec2 family competence protein, partial [Clostridia bacterium]|nr:ComEC/Rec2 family competence protein [Clostridia bacterium]
NNKNIHDNIRQPLLASGMSVLFCFLIFNFLHIYCSFVLMGIFLIFFLFFYFFVKNKDFALIFASVFISSGIFIFNFYKNDIFTNSLKNQDIKITGYIIDMPVYSNNICKYNIQVESIENIKNFKKIPKFKMQLISQSDINCDIYQKFKAKIHVQENTNLKEFLRLKSQNIKLSGFVSSYEPIERLEIKKNINYYILKIKENLLNYITKIFDNQSEAFIRAFLFRDRSKLNSGEILLFSESGISHFLAISGFHLAIIINILLNLFKFLNFKKRFSYLLCCVFILFFMFITGFTPSIMRSGIMFLIFILSKIFFKNYDALNSLGVALIIILLINPDSCLDIGLWMSFLSSASIITFSNKLKKFIFSKLKNIKNNILNSSSGSAGENKKYIKNNKIFILFNYIISNFSDSLTATVCVLPVSCLYFKSFSLVFFISNILISFQIYILILISILAILFNQIKIFSFLPSFASLISKSIITVTRFLSKFSINLDYKFIPVCVAFALILISYYILFCNIKKDFFKILFMILIFFDIGIISYQINHANSFDLKIFCSNYSKDILISNQKNNIIILQSKNLNKFNNYLSKNIMILSNNNLKINTKNYFNIKDNIKYEFESQDKNFNMISYKINQKTWIKINLLGKIIIIALEGGDIKNLPEDFRKCDIFIAFKLPNNFQILNFKDIIFVDNSWLARFNYNKILKYKNYISDNYYNILINFKNNNYIISRNI